MKKQTSLVNHDSFKKYVFLPAYQTANGFQDLAEHGHLLFLKSIKENLNHDLSLRSESNVLHSSCINASLAIEIYLKSFLINPQTKKIDGKSGHTLHNLFKRIPEKIKVRLSESLSERGWEIEKELYKYANYFMYSRYLYEDNEEKIEKKENVQQESFKSASNQLILLSRDIRESIKSLIENE
ncbi:HEPN domain-containing protein [Vibrio parahaemolyticus]|uniref:HEPN domain-containing protein n=1 Tax=Vibrio parahaemolyticus TaxID=670 RepID=UPI001E32BFC8|nr:HEPN domain-containing protein [Vibrio parahaemolyticus]